MVLGIQAVAWRAALVDPVLAMALDLPKRSAEDWVELRRQLVDVSKSLLGARPMPENETGTV